MQMDIPPAYMGLTPMHTLAEGRAGTLSQSLRERGGRPLWSADIDPYREDRERGGGTAGALSSLIYPTLITFMYALWASMIT